MTNVSDLIDPNRIGLETQANCGNRPTTFSEQDSWAKATDDPSEARFFGGHTGNAAPSRRKIARRPRRRRPRRPRTLEQASAMPIHSRLAWNCQDDLCGLSSIV